MRAYKLAKAYWAKRQMGKALWRAIGYNGDRSGRRAPLPISYEGPHVALTVLSNERKLKEHYRYTERSGLGITGANIHKPILS